MGADDGGPALDATREGVDAGGSPLARRHSGQETPGGPVPTDASLLQRTLAFSGSYVSDDGRVTIMRLASGTFEYSADRFVGRCDICTRTGIVPADGELLPDARAAERFLATHDHDDVD
jgi:hypothetical protein